MSVNQNEANLEAITITIANLEKSKKCDKKVLEALKEERDKLLRELNVHSR